MAWVITVVGVIAVAIGFAALQLPAATLFAALLVGLITAVARDTKAPLSLPGWIRTGGQAILGVVIGALVQLEVLRGLGSDWLAVLAAVLATLLISVASGLLLGLHRDVDQVTGSFALVAGGASGLTAISHELGADQRIVGVIQYLRVLMILLAMPVIATAVASGESTGRAVPSVFDATDSGPLGIDVLVTVGCVVVGLLVARLTRLPAGSLLGPLLVTAALAATGVSQGAVVPDPLQQVAYAVIGLQVGLSFTRASLRTVRRILPAAVVLIVVMTAATAAVGIPLLWLTGATTLDGYLATTPGGLYAVLATAVETGADTTLITSVQVLRLLVMLLVAPVLAVLLARRPRRDPPPEGAGPSD